MRQLLFTLLFAFTLSNMACSQQAPKKEAQAEKPVYEAVPPAQFQKMIKEQPGVIIDVRTASEQKKGMIEGAVRLDIFADNFEQSIDKLDRSKTYYVYCAAGGRSQEACEMMQKKGFVHLVDLEGGFTRWRNEGLPVKLESQ